VALVDADFQEAPVQCRASSRLNALQTSPPMPQASPEQTSN
jgi:hypothetical protein